MAALRRALPAYFGIDTYTLDEEILMLSTFTASYLQRRGRFWQATGGNGGKKKR